MKKFKKFKKFEHTIQNNKCDDGAPNQMKNKQRQEAQAQYWGGQHTILQVNSKV